MTPPAETQAGSPPEELRNSRAFDLWAFSYDAGTNPLLALEQRCLQPLLTPVSGCDVLDMGCGSGRWLEYLSSQQPQTLSGADTSIGMLRVAARRQLPGVELVECSCQATPFPEDRFDLLLASFLLSYVESLDSFATEMSRIARKGANLFLSDMHPETQLRRGWKRSFHDGGDEIALHTVAYPLQEILAAFTARGWTLRAALEPEFGSPERAVFAAAERMHRYREAEGQPAIYIFHLQKSGESCETDSAALSSMAPAALSAPGESLAATAPEPQSQALTDLPILLLHVHDHCNCRCLMCDIWQRKNGKELDLADFARHRESLQRLGVRHVVLTGGEPLLHRSFGDLCGFLAECGVRITLLTTGLLLQKRAEIVADAVDEIIVSLDGPEEVHNQIRRVNGAWLLISEGIRAVRNRRPHIPVHGRSTVQKANHRLLRQTVAGAKALTLDSISFLAVDLTSQAFNRELVWPGERQSGIALSREQIEALESEVEALLRENADDIRTRYIVESPARLRGIVRHFREHLGDLPAIAPLCNAPWVSAVMELDGSVRPCFFHRSIGNTRTQTLEAVINGSEARNFRASLSVSDDPICQRCVCSLNYKAPSPNEENV